MVGKLECSGMVDNVGHKPKWNQASLDPQLMLKPVVDILQASILPLVLVIPILLWSKLQNNTPNIASPRSSQEDILTQRFLLY